MTTDLTAVRLRLRDLFEADADEIFAARKRGKVVSGTDISQSGADVEHAVRQVLSNRLPSAYSVGHGHVVDQTLATCGQFDVIVSDKFANPLLFSTKGQSDYVPIEAVYAVGEIKSRYDKQRKPFELFSKHMRQLRDLVRQPAERNFFLTGGKGRGMLMAGETSELRPCKNPLFSFMFFVEADNFKYSDIRELYSSTPLEYLPNIVCFLDQGLIVYNQFDAIGKDTLHFHGSPEFAHIYDAKYSRKSKWVFHKINGDKRHGAHLGWLCYMLASHLFYSTLQPADPMQYAYTILADPTFEQKMILD